MRTTRLVDATEFPLICHECGGFIPRASASGLTFRVAFHGGRPYCPACDAQAGGHGPRIPGSQVR